ncbi:MAG: hypothetical protein SPK50_03770 [Mobiluncus porci]|nr:hypothetical protein [Mobiluncus porci]MDD7540670.1 hypothetical protein [Mobiluncus porci]MDY5748233.1 hypothetical protein [Mobiluncus porci]
MIRSSEVLPEAAAVAAAVVAGTDRVRHVSPVRIRLVSPPARARLSV